MEAIAFEEIVHTTGKVKVSGGEIITLPIHYRDAEAVMAFFPVPTSKVVRRLPGKRFRPVELFPGTSVVALAAFEYRDTDIGPYNELGICYPMLYEPRFSIPLLPVLLEERYPRFGFYVDHLPVTTEIAWRGGVEIYGYPKFVANIHFEETSTQRTCYLSESGLHILTLRAEKPRRSKPETPTLTTYSILGDKILKTQIPTRLEVGRRRLGGATLLLGDHPIGRELTDMRISTRALEVRYISKWRSLLPGPCERYGV